MFHQNLPLNEIIKYYNCRKTISDLRFSFPLEQKGNLLPEKKRQADPVLHSIKKEENNDKFLNFEKKNQNYKRKEQIKPKKIITSALDQ